MQTSPIFLQLRAAHQARLVTATASTHNTTLAKSQTPRTLVGATAEQDIYHQAPGKCSSSIPRWGLHKKRHPHSICEPRKHG